jgi:hypothetical protein
MGNSLALDTDQTLILMPPQSCIFCGRSIQRNVKGRPATPKQLQQAASLHHPRPVTDTWICDEHRKRPPTSSSQKRNRSPSPDPSHVSSDTTSSSKRQCVAEILSTLAQPQQQPPVAPISTTDSTSSRSVTTSLTMTSTSTDDDTPPTSLTSTLVHPFEYALAQSKQSLVTSSCETSSSSTMSNVPVTQWKQYHDQLRTRVLTPNSRHNHMTHVVTSTEQDHKTSSNTTTTGRYLSVFDVHTKHDSSSPETNIIQQLQSNNKHVNPHLRSTSDSSTASLRHLRQALSFNPSYNQEAFSHHTISGPSAPPVVESTALSHDNAYAHLTKASETARGFSDSTTTQYSPQHNVFAPFINIDSIRNDTIKQKLKTIAMSIQHEYKLRTTLKHLEIECDHVFATTLDGFGIGGLQLYLKSGECVTWLHDELLWCSALNYMMKESIGCALWIAVGLHDLKQVMSVSEIDKLLRPSQDKKSKKDIMKIGELLDSLISTWNMCFNSPAKVSHRHLVSVLPIWSLLMVFLCLNWHGTTRLPCQVRLTVLHSGEGMIIGTVISLSAMVVWPHVRFSLSTPCKSMDMILILLIKSRSIKSLSLASNKLILNDDITLSSTLILVSHIALNVSFVKTGFVLIINVFIVITRNILRKSSRFLSSLSLLPLIILFHSFSLLGFEWFYYTC